MTVRAFKAKLQPLIQEIRQGVLGQINAYLYTIEFQKCGLPHAHIIVFLKPQFKLHSPEDIDSMMSSEFPEENAEILELIKKFMVPLWSSESKLSLHGEWDMFQGLSKALQRGDHCH